MQISIRYVIVQTTTGAMVNVRHSLRQAIEDCENMPRCHISREITIRVDEVLTVTSIHDIYIPVITYGQLLDTKA